jgi:hypothetical protein
MRFLRIVTLAFGLTGTIATAGATCSESGPGYSPDQNDTVSVQLTCDMKGWKANDTPGPGYVFTGISIVSKPHNGKLRVWGKYHWSYGPKSPGSDFFSFKQCATHYDVAHGCSTLNYTVTITN